MMNSGKKPLPPYLLPDSENQGYLFNGPYEYLRKLPLHGPSGILDLFDRERKKTVSTILTAVHSSVHPFNDLVASLQTLDTDHSFKDFFSDRMPIPERLLEFFMEIQVHVYSHPIWNHPFLDRFTGTPPNPEQMKRFAVHFFNYLKNANQNVALSVGRFYSLIPGKRSGLSERISEVTRHVLAQLIADEFHINARKNGDEFPFHTLSRPITSVARYRSFMDALEIPFSEQDEPMTHSMADLVLVQRILAGGESFTELESLASVAAGHFWGTPELYAIFLRGILGYSAEHGIPGKLTELEGFTLHSATDMSYALSFMMILFLHIHNKNPMETVKNVLNILLATKFSMLSDLQMVVFEEPPSRLYEMDHHRNFMVGDRRIELELSIARQKILDDTVVQIEEFKDRKTTPFVFRD